MLDHKPSPIVIASHERSGTHLAIDTFRMHFKECNAWKYPFERSDRLYLNFDALFPGSGLKEIHRVTAENILKRTKRPIVKTHKLPPLTTLTESDSKFKYLHSFLNNAQTVYIYRDGRDVACSYWLFRRVFDSQSRVGISEFLRQLDADGKTCILRWKEHVIEWMNHPGVITVKFEDLTRNTDKVLEALSSQLSLTRSKHHSSLPRPWRSMLESRIKCRICGIHPRATTIIGRKRFKDKASWRNVFNKEDLELFNQQAGDLLVKLGYEI